LRALLDGQAGDARTRGRGLQEPRGRDLNAGRAASWSLPRFCGDRGSSRAPPAHAGPKNRHPQQGAGDSDDPGAPAALVGDAKGKGGRSIAKSDWRRRPRHL